jgi:hypothetical protein
MVSIPFIGKEDERIKAGEFQPNNNHEDDCAGNWQDGRDDLPMGFQSAAAVDAWEMECHRINAAGVAS